MPDPTSPKLVIKSIICGAGSHSKPQTYIQEPGLQGVGVIYTRRGRAEFRVPGHEPCYAGPGDLTLLRPIHSQNITYGPAGPKFQWATYWAHFEPRAHWYAWFNWPMLIPGVFQLHPDSATPIGKRILETMQRLCRKTHIDILRKEAKPHPLPVFDFTLLGMEEILALCRVINPNEHSVQSDTRVDRVVSYLDSHYARRITLEELQHVAGLSSSQLIGLFSRQVGATPFQYLEQRRVRQATVLLFRTEMSIAQIAQAVGYSDPLYFSRRFHKLMHLPPRTYQHSARNLLRGIVAM